MNVPKIASQQDKSEPPDLLSIYLRDHRAGAAAGRRLVQRCRDGAVDGELAAMLAWLTLQIIEDGDRLDEIMTALHIDPSRVKSAVAVVGEQIGRLKLNGRWTSRSPVSSVVELEALAAAVLTKRNLWRSLQALKSPPAGIVELATDLEQGATEQLRRVEEQHARAAGNAFGTGTA